MNTTLDALPDRNSGCLAMSTALSMNPTLLHNNQNYELKDTKAVVHCNDYLWDCYHQRPVKHHM